MTYPVKIFANNMPETPAYEPPSTECGSGQLYPWHHIVPYSTFHPEMFRHHHHHPEWFPTEQNGESENEYHGYYHHHGHFQ
jgi:hypothetical protein